MKPEQSIREAYVEASSFLSAHQVMEPESNSRLLLEWVLGLEGTAFYMAMFEPFPYDKQSLWQEVIMRKVSGEPAQYIIGEQEFYGERFIVTPAVLIPRPETELLVEAVVKIGQQLMEEQADQSPFVCADIGTGSGAIALTIARMCPTWQVYASDISPDALAVAKQNSIQQQTPILWREGNLLEPFAGQHIDILVSNPPYIPDADILALQPEVKDYEPMTALAGGPDGLGPYRIMMAQLALLPTLPKVIGFELGIGQAQDVADMVRSAGYEHIEIVADLAGIERHVIGIKER
ncbi:peptide chain release factor N(5)-glutamine methyltransferase [Paenibacillus nicotianae]|uniref:Release factor glutamine methyltransferase n=1 Tax=Paenibacillus nicotianae TaxID=1526551 RepID=A0ABW4V275_9BACL